MLSRAEKEGYHILITTDKNLRYQQNLTGRQLSVLVLISTSWPRIRSKLHNIQSAIEEAKSGSYQEIQIWDQ
ncbi:hypothetical protein WJR50_14925 [Catalinimonas sp. 4WD22]|uniref:hypothetical protein n=1 Tax=Catalinimonas locisalis TaxID=3133978 RepID=UPI0031015C0F